MSNNTARGYAFERNGHIFTLKPWPARVKNPAKFRYAVYRDGLMVGGARTKQHAEDHIKGGWYDDVKE